MIVLQDLEWETETVGEKEDKFWPQEYAMSF